LRRRTSWHPRRCRPWRRTCCFRQRNSRGRNDARTGTRAACPIQ
jgi:hypothetical protein